jgi:hypothetical protein
VGAAAVGGSGGVHTHSAIHSATDAYTYIDHNRWENENLAGRPEYAQVQAALVAALRVGPEAAKPRYVHE